MALSDDKRALIESGIAESLSPKEIAEKAGVSITTVYNYKKQELDDPKGTAPPNITTEGKGKNKRTVKKPITEETAGQLCAGLFAIAAMIDGPEWFLTPEEKESLASPLAESLRVLPAPIAEGVNLYSAPVVFITSLSAIMYKKGTQRARRGNRPPLRAVPQQQPQSAQASQPVVQTQTVPASSSQPSTAPVVDLQPALIAAAAAAKGGLTGIDEADTGGAEFQ